jgi:hypothetical protein
MAFDRAFQPIVVAGKVIFGSSVDGKVTALDVVTGKILWTFATEGPIRFAPAAWKDQVLVASDDGFLYALSSATGNLLWKQRGGPNADAILGNERMISKWPARGGPVVAADIVYFAAGIWPSDGIFLYALDAKSLATNSLFLPVEPCLRHSIERPVSSFIFISRSMVITVELKRWPSAIHSLTAGSASMPAVE